MRQSNGMKRRQFLTAPGALALVATILLGSALVWSRVSSAAVPNPSSIYLPSIRTAPIPNPTAVADHFGVIVSSDLGTVLTATGITWWYSFGEQTPSGTDALVAQISLRPDHTTIKRVPSATLVSAAQPHPASYWIIGNEPNVPGQDSVTTTDYATELDYYAKTIKGADPSAKMVGPNVLNWDSTCTGGCGGFPSGSDWVKGVPGTRLSSTAMSEIDVWGLHTYPITWDHTPMVDPMLAENDIKSMSTYLATLPTEAKKPIWDTEFGILWAYDGIDFNAPSNSCVTPSKDSQGNSYCIAPVGQYDQAAVTAWMNQFVGWLAANASTYRLQRWFLYTSFGQPEPYATTYGGVNVVQGAAAGAELSPSGQLYRQWSLTPIH